MHRSFSLMVFFSGVLLFTSHILAKPQKASEDMILILVHHKSGPNDLDAKGLTEDKTMQAPDKTKAAEFEVYDVPYPQGAVDYFGYRVFLHRQSGRYWININGGASGMCMFLGPGKLADLRK